MIIVTVTDEQRERASKLYDFEALNNSITKGEGNVVGSIGEIVVCDYFDGTQANTYDYDIILNNKKIDVKTKKYQSHLVPHMGWNLNIPVFNTTQECDHYCFVVVSDDLKKACIFGFIKKENFYKRAVLGKKGEVDPNGNGVWKFRSDCYNLSPKELKLPKKIEQNG